MSAARASSRQDTAQLAARVEPAVTAAGFELEELVVTPAGRRSVVRVVVDREEGVTLDDIAEVSHAVSAVLDDGDDFGPSPYTLEVTSPGVDRPLTEPRHWRRNSGRLVTVRVGPADRGEEVTGRVTAVDGDGVTLAVEAKAKPGARRRPPTPRQVPWAQLGAGRVQVEFGRPAAGETDAETDADTDGDTDGESDGGAAGYHGEDDEAGAPGDGDRRGGAQ